MRNYTALSLGLVFVLTGALIYASSNSLETGEEEFNRISSEKEFSELITADSQSALTGGVGGDMAERGATSEFQDYTGDVNVKRSSDTNIQVSGVGEPDILKNTGEKIYYSPEQDFYWGQRANTSVFRTLPAENFSEVDEIAASGRMFLTNDSIISLGENITTYSRESHEETWDHELNSSIVAARKINDSLFFVLEKRASPENPCPVRPLGSTSMPCTSFYHPGGEVDTTYSLIRMDAETGRVEEKNGFTGSSSNTVVYMSREAVYLTYSETRPEIEVITGFLEEEGDQYLNEDTMERIEELQSYDISDGSLEREIQTAIESHFQSLGEEEARERRKELENGIGNYTDDMKRELSTTSIARFNKDLELEAQGNVPGEVNDQFSLSESEEGLRIATTSGNSWRFDVKPENDLYTLDQDLEISGSVKGMGLNEQIYSVRYVDDRAFVVTFRRVDPFHVIDLSDHDSPELTGELKLPGFSSYLHPLQENRILGIGEEEGNVKSVIFDVSGDQPEIVESKILDDYYSEISSSHHAFQIDRQNEVFFLPGSEGGHFFSYGDGLEQQHFVNISGVQRGAFVNQNFYVFGDEKAAVVDMEEWENVKEIRFRNASAPEPVPLPGPRVVE